MNEDVKERLEADLLRAQEEKVRAEIAVLRKTTPFTEGLKVFGSLVTVLGGAIIAVGGF